MEARVARLITGLAADRRTETRKRLNLPAIVEQAGSRSRATIVNLSCDGAMISATECLSAGSTATLSCGGIDAKFVVIWASGGSACGVRFLQRLSQAQLTGQLSRDVAIARWRRELAART